MKKLTVNIPDSIELDERDVVMIIASRLYQKGKLSLGQAAEYAGLTKTAFAEVLGKYDVSFFNYPASDISRDVENA